MALRESPPLMVESKAYYKWQKKISMVSILR
jgi:hypothetical protein